jgi:hypothetical protein
MMFIAWLPMLRVLLARDGALAEPIAIDGPSEAALTTTLTSDCISRRLLLRQRCRAGAGGVYDSQTPGNTPIVTDNARNAQADLPKIATSMRSCVVMPALPRDRHPALPAAPPTPL